MVHIFVALEKDERGYPPFHTEEIDACIVSPDVVRIEGIPVFVRGMARGDLVKVKRVAGQSGEVQLWATGTEFASAHWTTRVLPVVTASLVAVDVSPTASTNDVVALLEHGSRVGKWDFDLGVGPPDGSMPEQSPRSSADWKSPEPD